MKWTDDQKEIFRHLIPTKRLLFLKTRGQLKVVLRNEDLSKYDYLVISSDFYQYYLICNAKLHIGKTEIDLEAGRQIILKKETGVVSKRLNNGSGLYEKCIVFPWETETKVCKGIGYWFNDVKPINDNGKMIYGYYDEKTQSIEAIYER
ncbi:MAG: hypothetical protein IJ784_04200 [Ruminiclostridium sp.]|nr:hypothetical protein [Ruminiclostridium sp.]